MRIYLQVHLLKSTPALVLVVAVFFFLWSVGVASGQESQQSWVPRIELLTMTGGKPNLSATGEGITSYKIGDLFQRGTTRVSLVKAADARFKIELPIGYSLFNNLIYSIETDAVFSGPSDITLKLPSAITKETFAQLTILYPKYDFADPEVPKWIDITLNEEKSGRLSDGLSESDIKERLRDFNTRTLHAFTEDEPRVLVVALRDPKKARDKFLADLEVSGSVTSEVMEGRSVTYELKITNLGPSTANAISLHAVPGFSFVSVAATEGKCRMSAQNLYCKLSSLKKDSSVAVKLVERCEWGRYFPDALGGYERPTPEVSKFISVAAAEQDPSYENNHLVLTTQVYPDPNKGPVIEVLSPTVSQMFTGPSATVPIRFKASDPDGFIKKVEVFAEDKSLGEATLRSDGEYELIYKDVSFGSHWVNIVATDNLGRVATESAPELFVNGTARVEIISPKAGSKLNLADGEFEVRIHASSPSSKLKKLSLDLWGSDATAVANDEYVVKLKGCNRQCRLQAIAIDENDVKTRSEYLEFTMLHPPETRLHWFDGEYVHEFETGKPFKVSELILSASADDIASFNAANITRIEILVNGLPVCVDEAPTGGVAEDCLWRPTPGKYKLQAIATDEDGAVGKTDLIEVLIERP